MSSYGSVTHTGIALGMRMETSRTRQSGYLIVRHSLSGKSPNKAFQTDKVAVSHLLQKAQKPRHANFAAEQRRYGGETESYYFVSGLFWIVLTIVRWVCHTGRNGGINFFHAFCGHVRNRPY